MGLLSGVDDFTGWSLLQKNGAAIEKSYAAGTSSAGDLAYLKANLPRLRSPDALLKDYRALSIVTTAYGLGSQVGQTAILRKLMTQDPNAPGSLAQQLADNRYLHFAQAMSTFQPAALFTPAAIANITSAYALQAPAGSATAAQVAFFQTIAPALKTPGELLSNPSAVGFVTTAFGMPEAAGQTQLLTNLLTQDPADPGSVAQRSGDKRYQALAAALSTFKPLPSSTADGMAAIAAGYRQNAFEEALGKDNQALQEASYFTRNAQGAVKLSQLMADPALLDVVRVAVGLPKEFGNLDYDHQVAILTARVDMKQFATAEGVAGFVQKYLAMDQLNGAPGGGGGDPLTSLFATQKRNSDGTGADITASLITPGSLNLIV